jgi:hypothetical protein
LDKSGVIIDTHGQAACDPVWQLLELAYRTFGVFPTLLERDFNIPPLADLLAEVRQIADLQRHYGYGIAPRAAGWLPLLLVQAGRETA